MNEEYKSIGIKELDDWAQNIINVKDTCSGYPVSSVEDFDELNSWLHANNLDNTPMNNVGDPFAEKHYYTMNTLQFEKEVIEYFAPKYGFREGEFWGIVSHSGTDGNAHGLYFGCTYLKSKSNGVMPIAYISDEAHYSNVRLTYVQNIEVRVVKSDINGRMIPEELEKALDPSRPALIIYAFGSTFKGAIDDIDSLNAVLAKYPDMLVYRHVDAALFGGYLPFTEHRGLLDCSKHPFESIAVSGHKFFGTKNPSGFFITKREVYDQQTDNGVQYLKSDMKMINCSRNSMGALQLWWLIRKAGEAKWTEYADKVLSLTRYMVNELRRIGYPCFVNDLSNTIVIDHPGKYMVRTYMLINSRDANLLGGKLSHFIVMQQMDKAYIDKFIADLKKYTIGGELPPDSPQPALPSN